MEPAGPSVFVRFPSGLSGVEVLERKVMSDSRGDFSRLFCVEELGSELLGGRGIVQVNLSRNLASGTVRGLHLLLPPSNEHKIVTCVQGAIWDVAVDLRPNSPTLYGWFGTELRSDENRSVAIPPGVAHGYQVLEPNSSVLYLHSEEYHRDRDAGVRLDDPGLAIPWPLPITTQSSRDAEFPSAAEFIGRL